MFIRAILLTSLAAAAAFATSVAPQCPSAGGANVVALGGPPNGPDVTFCVSDYGWSNAWFATDSPGNNPGNQASNMLGDSGQFIEYTPSGGFPIQSWLTPDLSSGAVSSNFSVVTPLTMTGPDSTTSSITDGTVVITIDSTVVDDMLSQSFTVTTNSDLTDITFGQYFNFHPGGANNPSVGKISYQLVQPITGPPQFGLFVSGVGAPYAGATCGGPGTGCSTPNSHDVGTSSSVQSDISGNTPNNLNSATGTAGALLWQTASLGAGDSQTFTVELVPEPATVGMMLLGGAALWIARRRRARV